MRPWECQDAVLTLWCNSRNGVSLAGEGGCTARRRGRIRSRSGSAGHSPRRTCRGAGPDGLCRRRRAGPNEPRLKPVSRQDRRGSRSQPGPRTRGAGPRRRREMDVRRAASAGVAGSDAALSSVDGNMVAQWARQGLSLTAMPRTAPPNSAAHTALPSCPQGTKSTAAASPAPVRQAAILPFGIWVRMPALPLRRVGDGPAHHGAVDEEEDAGDAAIIIGRPFRAPFALELPDPTPSRSPTLPAAGRCRPDRIVCTVPILGPFTRPTSRGTAIGQRGSTA